MVFIKEEEACAILLLHNFNNFKLNRSELRCILKNNKISYHKPGPKNSMKSKKEMQNEVTKIALLKINCILKYKKKNILL